jgi:type IV pilus assembly protein PilE
MSRSPKTASTVAAGFTLVEIMVVVSVIAILTAIAIPFFGRALEQSQANVAAANLRAIWAAQRWWWLENSTYTSNLQTDLANNGLIEPQIATATTPYQYSVVLTDSNTFTATATRTLSPTWSGSFTIDQTGQVGGSISALNQSPIQAAFQ